MREPSRVVVGIFIQLIAILSDVTTKKDGAPLSACDNMTPLHYSTARTDPPPFTISVSSSTYTPGSALTVTLRRVGSSTFKGFLVQVRTADSGKDQSIRYGRFSPGPNSRTSCSEEAVTHVINDDKTEVTFTWTPPLTIEGDLQFRTTYVERFSNYWIGVNSVIIKPSTTTQSTEATSTPSSLLPVSTAVSAVTYSSSSTDKTSATELSPLTTKQSVVDDGDGAGIIKPLTCLVFTASAIFLRL